MDVSSEKLKVHIRWLEPIYHKGQLQHTKVVLKIRPNSTAKASSKDEDCSESSNDYFDHISNRGEISTHSLNNEDWTNTSCPIRTPSLV